MGGSSCPPEIMRKLQIDLNIKEMMVRVYMSYTFSQKMLSNKLLQHSKRHTLCLNSQVMEALRIVPLYFWDSHMTTRS